MHFCRLVNDAGRRHETRSSLYVLMIVNKLYIMSLLRAILAIIFPPLAVIDKGCGSILIVTLLSILCWIPGVIAALIILNEG